MMKDKVFVLLFVGILFVGGIFSLFGKKQDISLLERRNLMSEETLQKDFLEHFDTYLSDHFFLRDTLLSVSSFYERYVLQNHGHRGVFITSDSLIEKSKPMEQKKVQDFGKKIEYIYQNYLKNQRVFYTLIPDKAFFLDSKYPKLDYSFLFQTVSDMVTIPYIDSTSFFSLEDYFQTDIHLQQHAYFNVLKQWSKSFELPYQAFSYQENSYFPFSGVTHSKVPSFSKQDTLFYYDLFLFQNVSVNHLEYGMKPVYDKEKLQGFDPYEVFLSGPSALIEITNPDSLTDRELILFRDSFGSSFTPLLIPYYQKITMVDLRYIPFSQVIPYLNSSSDVFFAYSTLLVLDSPLLKVSIS